MIWPARGLAIAALVPALLSLGLFLNESLRPAILAVGAVETPPFFEQAERFAKRLGSPGFSTIPGADHMTIVRDLGRQGSECATLLAQTIAASRRG